MRFITLLFCLSFNLAYFSARSQSIHVYIFMASECPICNFMGKPLAKLSNDFPSKVKFYSIFPLRNSNYKKMQLFKRKYGLEGFESVLDKDQIITQRLDARVTPEAIITDDAGNILYRGRINDTYSAPGKMKHSAKKEDLRNAIETILMGHEVKQPWPKAIGCFITRKAK